MKRLLLFGATTGYQTRAFAESAAALEVQVLNAIRAGDVLMVKGSNGSKMKTIVNALEKRFPGNAALDETTI